MINVFRSCPKKCLTCLDVNVFSALQGLGSHSPELLPGSFSPPDLLLSLYFNRVCLSCLSKVGYDTHFEVVERKANIPGIKHSKMDQKCKDGSISIITIKIQLLSPHGHRGQTP